MANAERVDEESSKDGISPERARMAANSLRNDQFAIAFVLRERRILPLRASRVNIWPAAPDPALLEEGRLLLPEPGDVECAARNEMLQMSGDLVGTGQLAGATWMWLRADPLPWFRGQLVS